MLKTESKKWCMEATEDYYIVHKKRITEWIVNNEIKEDERFASSNGFGELRYHKGRFEEYVDWFGDGSYCWLQLLGFEIDELLKSEKEE